MATIQRRKIGNQEYYYLEHTLRDGKNFQKKEQYLGKTIPKNIEEIKELFLNKITKESLYPLLEDIKKAYTKEQKNIPLSAKEIETKKFVIKFTYDTQRIEGSTLSLRETADLLERGITPTSKPIRDVKEAEAHKRVFEKMLGTEKELSLSLILEWHRELLSSTKQDIAGKIRTHQVAISGSKFLPPSPVEVYPELQDFFKWYAKTKDKINPVELAALVHIKFVAIHPFGDGNGRISRLMMNFILKKHKYPLMNIPYENRNSYYNALERSHIKKNDSIFAQWFMKRYIKEYKK